MKTKLLIGGVLAVVVASALIIQNRYSTPKNEMDRYLSMSNEAINELPKYDRPDLADLHNYEMTKDPSLGYPPSERLMQAYSETRQILRKQRVVNEARWIERGPNNFGGRTRAIMFDPNDAFANKVWAAGVAGGLWYNNDITSPYSEWYAVNDFFGNIAINALAFDPINTNTMYFGTGEGWGNADAVRGNGIWKSTDGGETWDHLASTANDMFYYVQKIAVTKNSTILAATRNSAGILRSADGGETWEEVISEQRGADIEIVGDIIYASTGLGATGKMWKSTDDGITWTEITPKTGVNRIEIGVHPNHPNTLYAVAASGGNIGGFWKSSNAGDTWENVTIPKYYEQGSCEGGNNDFARGQAWYDLILAVDPTNKNHLIVGGIDLYKTEDGGKSWDLITYWTGACDNYVHADQHNFIFRPGYPSEALSTNDGGVYYTNTFDNPLADGGPAFEPRNNGFNIAQFYACAMINEAGGEYYLAGAQDNGSHQFFNPGINSTNEITGGDGAFCFIDQDNSDFQITSYVYNSYWITRNGWSSDSRVELDGSVGRFINPAEYNSNTNTLFAAGDNDQIVRYALPDEGDIEAEALTISINEEVISALSNSGYDDDIMFIGTGNGSIYKLSNINDAISAELISTDAIEEDIYISSIAMGEDINHLLVTASNYGIVSVYETIDGGTTWTEKEGNLPDMPIRWALFNPNNYSEVLLATELGVWSTNDISADSPIWQPANTGLANVRCDMIKYRDSDGLIAVATHGRGLYTSDILATLSSANFISQDQAYVGQSIAFTNASIKADSYIWDFGDTNSSIDESPEHVFTTPGTYEIKLEINGDASLTKTKEIKVLPYREVSYTLAQGGDFESNLDDFYPVTIRGTGFELGSSDVSDKAGTTSGSNAWVTGLSDDAYAPNTEAYLYSPLFDFSASGTYEISFETNYRIEDEWEGFTLEFTLDNGASWNKLGGLTDDGTWYNQVALASAVVWTPGESFFSGNTDGYETKSLEFTSLSNRSTVGFRFVFKTDGGTEFAGIAIDDFMISAPDNTTAEVSYQVSTSTICEGEIITFENTSVGAIDSYVWNFGANASPTTATGYGPHKVIFNSSGTADVTLNGVTGETELNFTESISVSSLPGDLSVDEETFEVCAQESITVLTNTSESGINYYLVDVVTMDTVAEALGDGESISLASESLQPGLYEYRILAESNGCGIQLSPFISARVKENPAVVIIELGAGKLTVSPGEAYQWYLDGSPIEGATEKDYSPMAPGVYTAHVTFGECVSISDEYIVNVLGQNVRTTNELLIYPNPTFEVFRIKSNMNSPVKYVQVIDQKGALIAKQTATDNLEILIKCDAWKSGTYFVQAYGESGLLKTEKVVIK